MEVVVDCPNTNDIQKTATTYKPEINSNINMTHDVNNDSKYTAQFVPPEMVQETFMSSQELSDASNSSDWDLLLSRGTGNEHISSRWDRQSLYQKFDPLVSQTSLPQQPTKQSNAAKLESLKEQIRRDEWQFTSPKAVGSKLITIDDTPIKTVESKVSDNSINQQNITNSSNTTQSFSTTVNPLADETFVSSSALSNASNAVEWDLLINRGTGSYSQWDRQSLYQRFDPLVSHSPLIKPNARKLEDLQEQTSCPESPMLPSGGISNLISITPTPPYTQNRKMTRRKQSVVMEEEDEQDSGRFIKPLPESPTKDKPLSESPAKHKPLSDSPEKDEPLSESLEKGEPISESPEKEKVEPISESPEKKKDEVVIESPSVAIRAAEELEIMNLKELLDVEAINFQQQMDDKEKQLKDLEDSIAAASKELEDENQENRVLEEYEKSIEKSKKDLQHVNTQIAKIEEERLFIAQEQKYALDDLIEAEHAFSDLHSKYERVKEIVNSFKKNEEILLNRFEEMKIKVEKRDAKLQFLQKTVEDTFGRMKHDYESEMKAEELENQRIRAQVKKLEFRIVTCEKDLTQKEKENTQLSLLCDDLIKGRSGKM